MRYVLARIYGSRADKYDKVNKELNDTGEFVLEEYICYEIDVYGNDRVYEMDAYNFNIGVKNYMKLYANSGYGNVAVKQGRIYILGLTGITDIYRSKDFNIHGEIIYKYRVNKRYRIVTYFDEVYAYTAMVEVEEDRITNFILKMPIINLIQGEKINIDNKYKLANIEVIDGEIKIIGEILNNYKHTGFDYKAINKSLRLMGIRGLVVDSLKTAWLGGDDIDKEYIIPYGVMKVDGGFASESKIDRLIVPSTVKQFLARFDSMTIDSIDFGGTEKLEYRTFIKCTLGEIKGLSNIKEVNVGVFIRCNFTQNLDLSEIKGTMNERSFMECHARGELIELTLPHSACDDAVVMARIMENCGFAKFGI